MVEAQKSRTNKKEPKLISKNDTSGTLLMGYESTGRTDHNVHVWTSIEH